MVTCYDCEKEIKKKKEEIVNGKLLKFLVDGEEIYIYKCDECFKKNPSLTNFRSCEVYSRIVGYLRPVQQWNKGKAEEYTHRVNFKSLWWC